MVKEWQRMYYVDNYGNVEPIIIKEEDRSYYYLYLGMIKEWMAEDSINTINNICAPEPIYCTKMTFKFIHNGSMSVNLEIIMRDGSEVNLVLKDFPPVILGTERSLNTLIISINETKIKAKRIYKYRDNLLFDPPYLFAPGNCLIFSISEDGRGIANLYNGGRQIVFDTKSSVRVLFFAKVGRHYYVDDNGDYQFKKDPENSEEQH